MANKQITVTLSMEQEERFAELQDTNMAGEAVNGERKTDQELMFQIINAGLTAVEQQRKQYQKQKDLKKIGRLMNDQKFARDNQKAYDALRELLNK